MSLEEKRKSNSQQNSEVLEARVIANFGDPALQEDFAFDIGSRYLIVAIESSYRVPTLNKWNSIFAVVARPRNLWVEAEGGKANSYSSQSRSDPLGNLSVGVAGSFSTNGIPPIDKPYQMGELIKIKKLSNPLKFWNGDDIFQSVFNVSADQELIYNSWHNEGSSFPYFVGHQDRIDALRYKTIFNPDANAYPFWYGMTLYKYQYEAFMLTLLQGDNNLTAVSEKLFANELPSTNAVYHGHGGYVFKNHQFVNFFSVDYEDLNVSNKSRTSISDCLPLVVVSPSVYPVPQQRVTSTINYSPSYSTIIKSN